MANLTLSAFLVGVRIVELSVVFGAIMYICLSGANIRRKTLLTALTCAAVLDAIVLFVLGTFGPVNVMP